MKSYSYSAGLIITIVLLSPSLICFGQELQGSGQIERMIRSIQGLTPAEMSELNSAFQEKLSKELLKAPIEKRYLESIKRIVNAGLFEEVDAKTIARVSNLVYKAEMNGAAIEYVEDLALIGFAQNITAQQLEAAAKALERFSETEIDPIVYQEIVAYGLANAWSGETIDQAAQGVIKGYNLGVDCKKLALAIIIRVDQDFGEKPFSKMVNEEIEFINSEISENKKEKQLRDIAFNLMQETISKGVPDRIAKELFYEAVENQWDSRVVQAVFNGMNEAYKLGLTPEKIAIAMIVRLEQGIGKTPPGKMVQEEIAFVKQIEKKRLDLIKKDNSLDYSKPVPDSDRYQRYLTDQKKEPGPDIYRQSLRTKVNVALMVQTIQSFLGVQYMWGGNTRRGTDCSGFTQSVYRDQGFYIPRVSYQQYRVGSSVSAQMLMYGDLVFFNKYGYGRISHVGIYIGNGQFAHASSSKGVTISPINKRYYRVRYAGAKRII